MTTDAEVRGMTTEIPWTEDALRTLQQMTGSDNRENPWLGVVSAVALIQINLAAVERERDALRAALAAVMGVSVEHVDAAMKRGKVNAEQFIAATRTTPEAALDKERAE